MAHTGFGEHLVRLREAPRKRASWKAPALVALILGGAAAYEVSSGSNTTSQEAVPSSNAVSNEDLDAKLARMNRLARGGDRRSEAEINASLERKLKKMDALARGNNTNKGE